MNRRQKALRDFVLRSKRGLFLHLPLWLMMSLSVDMAAKSPRVFWINCAGFLLVAVVRLAFIRRSAALINSRPERAQWIFRVLAFLPCFQWSVLSALSTQDGILHPLMLPLMLVVSCLATAGTVVLSIDRCVQVWYPLLALSPSSIGLLLPLPEPMRFLYATMGFFVNLYVFPITRVVHNDYWAALDARELLEDRARSLESLSTTDALTQIPNRLYFERCLEQAWVQGDQQPLSILLIDLDHFKSINDTYGHAVGDECLKAAARAMAGGMLRTTDKVARWGGEEFVVLLPNTDRHVAQRIAQRVLQDVARTKIPYPGGLVSLACSIGAATLRPSRSREPKCLIDEADRALYEAKSQGRNRVVSAAA